MVFEVPRICIIMYGTCNCETVSSKDSSLSPADMSFIIAAPRSTHSFATFPQTLISIDTFRGKVAKECVERGAAIINDISAGLRDESLLDTVSQLQVPYIMMHMRGTSKTMVK